MRSRAAGVVTAGVVCAAALAGCVFYLNPQCTDDIANGDETDIDCGGTCGTCALGRSCRSGGDCDNGNCIDGTCAPLPCANGVQDGDETDLDCGGGTCRKCAGDRRCRVDGDCFSGTCDQGTCSSLRTVSFADAVSYPSGFKTYAMFSADLNGDGFVDLAAANEQENSVSVFLGRGDGTFAMVAPAFATGDYPTGGAIADFNHDGILDVATANAHGNSVSVLLGVGDGTLMPVRTYPTADGALTQNLAVADLDRDGNLDVIAVNLTLGTASQFMGRSDGTLEPAINFPVGGAGALPIAIAIVDLDGDGKVDVVFAGQAIVVRLGNGDGSFGPEARYPGSGGVVIPVDIDLDGKLDLVSADRDSDAVRVYLGRGDGTFLDPVVSTTGPNTGPFSAAVADFNLDGVPDVVTANFTSSTASLLLGIGDGRFEAPISGGETGSYSYGVVAADFNRDGKPDFAICNAVSNDVKVKLNTSH